MPRVIFKNCYRFRYILDIPIAFIKDDNVTMCCAVNGTNINTTSITMEQRSLFDEHIWFVKSDHIKRSEMLTSSKRMFCLNVNGFHKYIRKKRYICMAQISINGRRQTINRTTYIEKNSVEGSILLIWNVYL